MRSVKGTQRERSFFPMDNIPHAAFPVSSSRTISMNGISVILSNHFLVSNV
jgi:hypothetical protein